MIRIIDSKALKLLEDLESLDLIRLVKEGNEDSEKKLSERLYGSLSKEQGEIMHGELRQMRSEWDRAI